MNTPRRVQRKAAALLSLAAIMAFGLTEASSQAFPTRPVRIVTAFPAGSGPDVALRTVADQLAARWRQPVIVDNRPGGNGFIAIGAIKKAAPDGHELIQLDSNHLTTHPYTFSKLPYDPQGDLEPVHGLFTNSFFVTVARDSPYASFEDVVAAARSKRGQLTYGSWFNGSPGHLGALRLQSLAGLEMLHVPYKEMSQLYAAVATKEVDWALGSAASAGALEKAGRIRFIAVASTHRSKGYPNVPTAGESPSGRGFEVMSWTGIFDPRGTPAELRERLSTDIAEALASAEVTQRFRGFDYEPYDLAPKAFAEAIRVQTRSWGELFKKTPVKLD